MKLICTDTETGGLDPQKYSLLSAAFCVLDTETRTVSNELGLVIKEDPLILLEAAMKVNNMNLVEIYKEGIPPREAGERICNYLEEVLGKGEKAILLGQNVTFDHQYLSARLPGVGERLSHRLVDTSSIARFLFTAGVFQEDISSNSKLFDYFEIPKEGRHTALGDCRGTAEVYLKMMDLVKSI